ncbi:MAG: alpha-E domain-containing protein [Burkholderiaceae bacterium]|nr:alpha-E domain-containing protein [Burkholderiaceae bacterium]
MLSRTADNLFWMARYTERAENTARMLDVHVQSALLPQGAEAMQLGWRGLLGISELTSAYTERHGEIDADKVLDFMVCDTENPSSIQSCLRAARENARAVRGAITTEVWETVNQTWLESQRMLANGLCRQDPAQYFEWVKYRSHLSRGVTSGTMLQDEAYHFLRIGTFLERADNTARLIDVKFHALQSDFYGSASGNGRVQEHDFYHWSGVLRSVSGFEVYRKVYRDVITPERVAGLLILRLDMPRSLAACMMTVNTHLRAVANPQSRETLRRAGLLNAQLQFGRLDDIMATGLHAYLTHFLERINDLGGGISQDFLAA